MIENYQVKRSYEVGLCSHVVISDRYALTAANCWETWQRLYQARNYFNRENPRFIIRQGTEFEEVMNVKRFWINPWRESTLGSAYYNVVVMEFGIFFLLF